MTTYFITGGFGFLGQHIVKAIHDHDPQGELRVFVRTPRQTQLQIEKLPRVRLIHGDLTQPDTFSSELIGVDTVIHNAALVSFKPEDADALYQSNVLGTRYLLDAAIGNGCKNFIYISSISAIGRRDGHLADETLIPDLEDKRQHDPYGYSKRLGEIEIQEQADQIRVVILNPSVIIGPGSRRIGAVLKYLKYIPILPMISTLNSFVDVRDVAQATVAVLSKGRSGERYLVTSYNVDMPTFTRTALHVMGMRCRVAVVPDGLIRVADGLIALLNQLHINPGIRSISAINVDKVYSTEKIQREMGWSPRYSLEESLADTLKA